jgi:ankyrin repeat protein
VVGQHGNIVQILLDQAADANIQTKAGLTALHYAARHGLGR